MRAGAVGRTESLRHDALGTEPERVSEDLWAVRRDVLTETENTRAELDQIEGLERYGFRLNR